jgi:hypothetical protein
LAKKPLTTKGAREHQETAPVAEVAAASRAPIITVPSGSTLTVVVDVGPMAIPYAVAYAGRTIIKSLVDRAEQVMALESGDRVLGWSFAHIVKGWQHAIGFSIDGGPVQLLERKSEANKDPDHTVGFAIVRH